VAPRFEPRRVPRRRHPTPGDLLLFLGLVAAVPLSRRATAAGDAGGRIAVQCGDETPRSLDPHRDADLELHGPLGSTRLRIRDGEAWIESSPCRQQLCRRMGRIHGPGRVIACLPNRVLVRFEGAAPGVDGVTR
jgi:hypothetical protein